MTFYLAAVFGGIQSHKCLRPATITFQASKAVPDGAWELILLFLLFYLIRGVHKFYCNLFYNNEVKTTRSAYESKRQQMEV